jgi:hypothetical protein
MVWYRYIMFPIMLNANHFFLMGPEPSRAVKYHLESCVRYDIIYIL